MEELKKVNSLQLYAFWKNLSVGLLTIVAMMTFTKLLPYYLSPVVSLIAAAVLYTMLYNARIRGSVECMIVPYAIFYCLISYCLVSIGLNVAYLWGYFDIPAELTFFNFPYIPILVMAPVSAVSLMIIYARRRRLKVCSECTLLDGGNNERGATTKVIDSETHFQLRNLIVLFTLLSAICWLYAIFLYVPDGIVNSRDWYVFTWLTVISFILDEVYFIFRYYNLYLDLKENDELITSEEIENMSAKTYVRFYVICGDDVYLDPHCIEPDMAYREVIDTPFVYRRNVNGMNAAEIRQTIERMTGVRDGELRFFYGRRTIVSANRSLLRYFYFLDGESSEYKFRVPGQWVDFDHVKRVYSNNPQALSPTAVSDITRLATIMLTHKTFDERGFRRNRIKAYQPTFNLEDVRKSNLDFQNEQWIRISMFNSDMPFYRLKRWWRNMSGRSGNNSRQWN